MSIDRGERAQGMSPVTPREVEAKDKGPAKEPEVWPVRQTESGESGGLKATLRKCISEESVVNRVRAIKGSAE